MPSNFVSIYAPLVFIAVINISNVSGEFDIRAIRPSESIEIPRVGELPVYWRLFLTQSINRLLIPSLVTGIFITTEGKILKILFLYEEGIVGLIIILNSLFIWVMLPLIEVSEYKKEKLSRPIPHSFDEYVDNSIATFIIIIMGSYSARIMPRSYPPDLSQFGLFTFANIILSISIVISFFLNILILHRDISEEAGRSSDDTQPDYFY